MKVIRLTYSPRIHSWGVCQDNAISWDGVIPKIDFEKEGWQEDLSCIIENYKEWGEKGLYYFENYWTPKAIFDYMMVRINKFRDEL